MRRGEIRDRCLESSGIIPEEPQPGIAFHAQETPNKVADMAVVHAEAVRLFLADRAASLLRLTKEPLLMHADGIAPRRRAPFLRLWLTRLSL